MNIKTITLSVLVTCCACLNTTSNNTNPLEVVEVVKVVGSMGKVVEVVPSQKFEKEKGFVREEFNNNKNQISALERDISTLKEDKSKNQDDIHNLTLSVILSMLIGFLSHL
jgi:hypothetical protein